MSCRNVLTLLLILFSCYVLSSEAIGVLQWVRDKWLSPELAEELSDRIVIPISIKQNLFQSIMIIGNKKRYGVAFDPSFSGIWVYSKMACERKRQRSVCKKISVYDDSKVQEAKKVERFELSYPYGKVSGFIIKDRIQIGQKVLDNQDIGIATEWDEKVVDMNLEGRFGIRVAKQYTENVIGDSFFDRFLTSKVIKEKTYSIYFNSNSQEGQLCLGGVNPRLIEANSDLVPFPVIEGQSGFILEINSIKVGLSEVGMTNVKALVNPASYNLAGKDDLMMLVIAEVRKHLKPSQDPNFGNEINMIDCEDRDNDKLPVVNFEINGHSFELHGHDYSLKYCQDAMFGKITGTDPCRCFLFFFPQKVEDYDMVLGTPFISKYYAKLDLNKMTVGFTKANHDKEDNDN